MRQVGGSQQHFLAEKRCYTVEVETHYENFSFRVGDSVIFNAHFLYTQHVVFCIVTPPRLAVAGHHYLTPEHDLNYGSSRMWFHNSEAHR